MPILYIIALDTWYKMNKTGRYSCFPWSHIPTGETDLKPRTWSEVMYIGFFFKCLSAVKWNALKGD